MTNVKNYTDKQLLDRVKSLSNYKNIPSDMWLLFVRSNEDGNNSFETAVEMALNNKIVDQFQSVGDRDYFKFSVTSPGALSASGLASIPHLEKLPMLGVIWQRPHIPRPPHTESMSTPSFRAASSTVVPSSKFPSRPLGVNTTRFMRCLIP